MLSCMRSALFVQCVLTPSHGPACLMPDPAASDAPSVHTLSLARRIAPPLTPPMARSLKASPSGEHPAVRMGASVVTHECKPHCGVARNPLAISHRLRATDEEGVDCARDIMSSGPLLGRWNSTEGDCQVRTRPGIGSDGDYQTAQLPRCAFMVMLAA